MAQLLTALSSSRAKAREAAPADPSPGKKPILAVASLIQTFHFTKADPAYRLTASTTLTIKKPKISSMKAKLRDLHFVDHVGIMHRRCCGIEIEIGMPRRKTSRRIKVDDKSKLLPMEILYGTKTGTC